MCTPVPIFAMSRRSSASSLQSRQKKKGSVYAPTGRISMAYPWRGQGVYLLFQKDLILSIETPLPESCYKDLISCHPFYRHHFSIKCANDPVISCNSSHGASISRFYQLGQLTHLSSVVLLPKGWHNQVRSLGAFLFIAFAFCFSPADDD